MTDLVERLRDPHLALDPRLLAAADEIERLQAALDACADYGDKQVAEIERLRKECFALAADQCHDGVTGEHGDHVCREIERLRAQVERLQQQIDQGGDDL